MLAALGVVSGIISGLTQDGFALSLQFGPGLIFGFITGLYFLIKYSINLLKIIAWVLASTASYYLAFSFAMNLAIFTGNNAESVGFLPYLGGGMLGGFLVALSFSFLIRRLYFFHTILLACLGGILAFFCSGGQPGTTLFVVWQTGMILGLYIAMRRKMMVDTSPKIVLPQVVSAAAPDLTLIESKNNKVKILGILVCVLFVGIFGYRAFAHDNLILRQVKGAIQYLENYYEQYGYYPTAADFEAANPDPIIYPNPNYGYDSGSYSFNQTYSLRYSLNRGVDDAPGHPIMDWGYKGQSVTSCDTRNVCEHDYELDTNPKGIRWFAKPIASFTAGVTMNPEQAIYWLDSNTNNYRWQLSEKYYVGPAQTDFSYDTSLLTELKPREGIDLPWYKNNKGSYFKALKPGETVFKVTVNRLYYDTGYEDGTYGGSKHVESYSQEIKIKIVDDPGLLDQGYPIEQQRNN